MRTRRYSLYKTLSWRVVASLATFFIAWGVTGELRAGLAIGGVDAAIKTIIYYYHERAWEGKIEAKV